MGGRTQAVLRCVRIIPQVLLRRGTVGPDAMKVGGWQRLHAEYAKQFGVEAPGAPS
jgi:hypothetical protein